MAGMNVIILWDRCFDRFLIFSLIGRATWENGDIASFNLFASAQIFCDQKGWKEVYINSRIGRQILARIGAQKP
jgi:hypothetical protein